jgi:hypothetical protein
METHLKWVQSGEKSKETQTLFWPMAKQGKGDKEDPTTDHI